MAESLRMLPSYVAWVVKLFSLILLLQIPCTWAASEEAAWIAESTKGGSDAELLYFRKHLVVSQQYDSFPIRISADNRFRLYVNGQFVASGPERSDIDNWRYHTLDLAKYLNKGNNSVAVEVWNWGELKPVAQYSVRTALLVEGLSEAAKAINSNDSWLVYKHPNYQFIPVDGNKIGGYYAASPGESMHGAGYPYGWREPGFDDKHWLPASALPMPVMDKGVSMFGVAIGWMLTPNLLPQMEESPIRFESVRLTQGVQADSRFLQGKHPITIPAHSNVSILLDQTHLTNAYPIIETSGGAGSEIQLTYAESLKYPDGTKGNRNEIKGKSISGLVDKIYPAGLAEETFQPLWFRTYRYVELAITTKDKPLTLNDIHATFTAYPLEQKASFSANEDWIKDMWAMNWRTMRLCAYDTYFDTPYYEQLQYTGDTRIQSLLSLYLSGDDKLMRQALLQYANSISSEGLTASRYPSSMDQFIPPFSLVWIMMVHDYWMMRDDPEFVAQFLPTVRGILNWFEQRVREDGMVGPVSWWPFMDWVPEWHIGIPPGGLEGGSTLITLQFAYAAQMAAELEKAEGVAGQGKYYQNLASALTNAVNANTWDSATGLYKDTPEGNDYSQQTNIMAILTDTIAQDKQAALMEKLLSAPGKMSKATYYYQFYLFEALRKVGLGGQYIDQLKPWQAMLARGLTTTPEQPDPTRSDSHAWAAHPNYGLLSIVLGIRPASAGFKSVEIAPNLGRLTEAKGAFPHPYGPVEVALKRQGKHGVSAVIILPPKLTGIFKWQGKQIKLHSGQQTIQLP